MAHWTVLAFLMPALLAVVFWPLGLHADPDTHSSYASASCFRKETYNTTSKVKVQVPVNKTRYDWCLGGFMRCVVYKVEMAEKEINVTEIRSRIVEMCCPGMIPAPGTPVQSSNESLQCIPAPGSGQPPITSSPAPIVTTTSKEVCKTGLWGRGCSHTCSCGGAPCNQDTGACLPCSPNDTSCAPFTSTTGSTTTSSTTTAVPTTPSSTPPTTTSPTPQPSTTSTTTMIATLATTKTSTLRSVETSPRVSLSNASDFPVAASTQTPRTIAKPTANVNQEASVEYSFTTLGSVHDISQLGSLPGAGQPSSPSTVEAGGAGVTVATIAIALAILTILCVLVTFVRTLKRRNKRRPRDVPPPSPPLISAWHSEPHYSETFAVPAPVQPTAVPTFSDQFEQPVVEHVYQEITPLANVIETSVPPTDTSTRQDTGPTKVLVKLRTVETYVVR